MAIPFWVVDAFAAHRFAGNPAAVCILERWLDDALMQSIAAENNLSETAFLVERPDRGPGAWDLRWFTPGIEIDLCGHATLASAHVIFETRPSFAGQLAFTTRSGVLRVDREGDLFALEFPRRAPVPREAPAALIDAVGRAPKETLHARDFLFVYEREADIRALEPRMEGVARAESHGVIVTAPGDTADYVLRFFAPAIGVPEDPVTGSVQCALVPYWAARLGKTSLRALQLSKRGGELFLEDRASSVRIRGKTIGYSRGTIEI